MIGPQLLYSEDQPVKSTWSLIFDNARFGDVLLPDIKTIYENLVFLCWYHHRLVHDGGWALTGTPGNLTWTSPDGSKVLKTGPPPDVDRVAA